MSIAIVLVAAGLAVLWRLPSTPAEWMFARCENDSLFHLHRIQETLRTYPEVPSVDLYSHHPYGYRVHWPAPHAAAYATVARVAGAADDDLAGLEDVVSWIPPLLGPVAVVLVALVTRAYSTAPLATLVAVLLAALTGESVRPFFYGTIDHHLFAHLGVLLAALGRLRRNPWLWSLGLLSLCAMTPEAVLYVSLLLALVFAAEWLAWTGGAPPGPGMGAFLLAPAAVGLASLGLHRALQSDPLPLLSLDWTQPTSFQVAWYAALGVSMTLPLRPRATSARRACVAAAPLFVAACALAFLALTGSLTAIGARLGGAGRIFVGEEASVFRAGWWQAHPWYQFLTVLLGFHVCRLGLAWARGEGSDSVFRWLLAVAALGIGFSEYRHLYVLSGLQAVAVAAALAEAARLCGDRFGERWAAPAQAALAAALLVPFLLSADITDRGAARATACSALPMLHEVTTWMRQNTPSPSPSESERPTYGVFGSWAHGHQLHVLGERPVVLDPFNYESDGRVESLIEQLWLARDLAALLADLRGLGVRYVVLTNPAEEIVGAIRRRGTPVSDLYRRAATGSFDILPDMTRFAAFALFVAAEERAAAAPGLTLRYATLARERVSLVDDDGAVHAVDVPRARVYELDGAPATP